VRFSFSIDIPIFNKGEIMQTKKSNWILRTRSLVAFSLPCLLVAVFASIAHADNVALNKVAWANSVFDPYMPSNAVDGNLDTVWSADDIATLADPNWLTVDLGAIYPVDSITLTGVYSNGQFDGCSVDYLLFSTPDGADWVLLGQGSLVDSADLSERSDTISGGGRDMRYVWFIGTGGTCWTGLAEFEVQTVPEPSSIALLITATVGGLLWWRRR